MLLRVLKESEFIALWSIYRHQYMCENGRFVRIHISVCLKAEQKATIYVSLQGIFTSSIFVR